MTIRHATMDDLDIISLIETTSFHKTEAAKKEEIKERIQLNSDFFWLLDDFGEVLGCGACLESLRRKKIGRFSVEEAIPFERLLETDIVDFASCVKPLSAFLR